MSGSEWGKFLKERSFRGGFNRLRNWKENGEIVVWIHTKTLIHKRAFHMVPYVGQKEDENTGKKRTSILYLPFVCHEDVEDIIKFGKNHEPTHCPLCRFIDHLKNNGSIADGETVWDSSVNDRKRDRICSKADFVGDTDGGGDWRLSFKPAIQYVLAVIDNEHPDEGICVAAEKYSLGEKIKAAVIKEIDRKGPDEGDPNLNPYAFKFIFNSKARQPADYYDAYPLDRVELTAEIEELLGQDAQDLTNWISPGDTKILREAMEAHVTVDDVDFDELFDNVLENVGTQVEEPEEAPPKTKASTKKTETKKASKPKATKERKVAKEPEPDPEPPKNEEPEVPMMECPSCRGKGEKKNGKECKVCDGTGLVEAPDDDEEEEAPTPPPPKETKGRTKERKVATPPPPEDEEDSQDEEEDVAECARCHKDVAMSATSCPHCGATFQ